MTKPEKYFELARTEEKYGNAGSALLFYLSSFCASCNLSPLTRPYGTVEKIRRIQSFLGIEDSHLFDMVRSYGHLSDHECRFLLHCSLRGSLDGIDAVSGDMYG